MTFSSFHDPAHLFFVTASIIGWKHLFINDEYARIPLNSLAWLQQQKRILLVAFVIMPSHLHAILKPESDPIGDVIQQFGSFTAHEVLKKIQKEKRDGRHKHSIWQDIQAKNIYSMNFLLQKLEYIHQNPVAKNWKLVKDWVEYPYSSAGYYDYGRKPILEITNLNDWLTSNPSPSPAKGA